MGLCGRARIVRTRRRCGAKSHRHPQREHESPRGRRVRSDPQTAHEGPVARTDAEALVEEAVGGEGEGRAATGSDPPPSGHRAASSSANLRSGCTPQGPPRRAVGQINRMSRRSWARGRSKSSRRRRHLAARCARRATAAAAPKSVRGPSASPVRSASAPTRVAVSAIGRCVYANVPAAGAQHAGGVRAVRLASLAAQRVAAALAPVAAPMRARVAAHKPAGKA